MNNYDIETLSNGIKVIIRKNPNTPRTAVNLFLNTGVRCNEIAGISSLAARLLLQGTEKRTAEQIAEEIDANALELAVDAKADYTKARTLFLNEDLQIAVEIMADIVKNSTFKCFEKEVRKFKGEIEVDLDSARVKASDNLVKNLYPEHPYGNSHTKILESLAEISEDAVRNYYYSALSPEKMTIVVVGDIDKRNTLELLDKHFGAIEKTEPITPCSSELALAENKVVTISKHDAAQAQVMQGWIVPNISHSDYPALAVLNTILGSSGLSSRLFVELRDKQGLAYVVRSAYDPMKYAGTFTVYIATEPKNIKVSLEGFKNEIKKLQEIPVEEKELENAKNNIVGKRAFFHETNSQQAHYLGHYDILGLGADFDSKIVEKIKNVTAQDVKDAALKYLSGNSVISVLAPEEHLSGL